MLTFRNKVINVVVLRDDQVGNTRFIYILSEHLVCLRLTLRLQDAST